MHFLLRVKEGQRPCWVRLEMMFPFFILKIVLNHLCLFLDLGSNWALWSQSWWFQRYIGLNWVDFEWIYLGYNLAFFDIDHIYENVTTLWYRKGRFLVLFLTLLEGGIWCLLPLLWPVVFRVNISILLLLRFEMVLWSLSGKLFRFKIPLFNYSENLVPWVTQRELVEFLSCLILVHTARLTLLTVNALAPEVWDQISIDWVESDLAIFEAQEKLLLVHKDECFWSLKVLDTWAFIGQHIMYLQRLIPVLDQYLLIILL